MNPQETFGQHTAVKKRAQFPLYEPRHQSAVLSLPGQKGLEVGGHHAVEDALFRPTGAVLAGGFADGDALAASREEAVRGRIRPSDEPVAA